MAGFTLTPRAVREHLMHIGPEQAVALAETGPIWTAALSAVSTYKIYDFIVQDMTENREKFEDKANLFSSMVHAKATAEATMDAAVAVVHRLLKYIDEPWPSNAAQTGEEEMADYINRYWSAN